MIRGNRLGDDLESTGNRGVQRFLRNRIAGDLECARDRPAPRGGANRVSGDRKGRCRRP